MVRSVGAEPDGRRGGRPAPDVIVVGGGHNGLVAAILAAQGGQSVVLLERSDRVGGASVSQQVFAGHDARLSRYSYLVSLMPQALIERLGIRVQLRSRSVSSYTPIQRHGRDTGILVERVPGPATEESFAAATGSPAEYRAWTQLYAELAELARVAAPKLEGPLVRRAELQRAVIEAAGAHIWEDVFEAPLGSMLERRLRDDVVRGIVATDGLIGTHASLHDASLLANRCFLYHLIGRGTGEWLVPVGGMGTLAAELHRRAVELGVQVRTGVHVDEVAEDPEGVTVFGHDDEQVELRAPFLMAAVAPTVLGRWRGEMPSSPVGSQLKINLLLNRLPQLRSGVDPRVAFAGTTHLAESMSELEAAYAASRGGTIPSVLPSEVYCHSITDPSILGDSDARAATLTLFGIHAPESLFRDDPDRSRDTAVAAALSGLQRYLAEPLEDCLAIDSDGRPCIDVATPVDVERSLAMPGGNIFHGDLSWPYADDDEELSTPAERYGVAVHGSTRILLAGAGSRRGGGVSGLGGLAAADALREILTR